MVGPMPGPTAGTEARPGSNGYEQAGQPRLSTRG
jgi:hypothetical protein